MKKQISIIIIILAIMMVASGCVQKDQKSNVKNQNEAKTEVVNNKVQSQEQSSQTATSTSLENVANSSEGIDTSDWETYRNDEYGFELKYPEDWHVSQEKDENNKKFFISFSNTDNKCSKASCSNDYMAFFVSVYSNSPTISDEYIYLFNEYSIIGSHESFENINGNVIDYYLVSQNSKIPDKTWDMVKPDIKAFYQDKGKSIIFYIATEIPSTSNGQKKEVEILKEVLKSYR